MKKTKSFYIILSIIIALLLGVFITGTIFDLEISKLLVDLEKGAYYSDNIIAIIGETFGENVLYILLECACGILFFHLIKNKPFKTWLNIVLSILLGLLGGVVCFYCFNKTLGYLSIHVSSSIGDFLNNTVGKLSVISMAIMVHVIVFLLFGLVSKKSLQELSGWAVAVLIIAAVSNGIVQGSKHIFDRTRYRAMVHEGYTNFEYYTPWFKINSNKFASTEPMFNDYFKSFPSGHTCAAASVFSLTLLPCFVGKLNKVYWKGIFVTFAILYTFFVGISRIVAGAHYFTDVFVGGMTTILCVFLYKIIYVDHIRLKLIAKAEAIEEELEEERLQEALKEKKLRKQQALEEKRARKEAKKHSKKNKQQEDKKETKAKEEDESNQKDDTKTKSKK